MDQILFNEILEITLRFPSKKLQDELFRLYDPYELLQLRRNELKAELETATAYRRNLIQYYLNEINQVIL